MLTLKEIQRRMEDRNVKKVAERIGITSTYLYSILKGERPRVSNEMMLRISGYLEGQRGGG